MSIEVQHVVKRFGSFTALDDVSLVFPSDGLVALLGPSGCGKTTLLRIIAGLDQADGGRVILGGRDASETHARHRRVGFVFQHYALFRHMTIFDNVAFGMRMKPRSARPGEAQIRAKVHELLALVGLGWVADRYPAQLSGGQRQRVAIARALAVEPQVLLLDEPFGALDAKVRRELRRWLRRLHEDVHITSVFVTHDQEEALEVADRIVVMNRGRIEQVGTPAEVYGQPATSFVSGFLGAVNLFHGRVEGAALKVGEHVLPHEAPDLPEGGTVVAFARPHELDIVPDGIGADGIPARISRILAFGLVARVDLEGLVGEPGQHYEVELTQARLTALGLGEGQTVRLVPSNLRVFEERGPPAEPMGAEVSR